MKGSEGPCDILERQTGTDMRVFQNIDRIIKIDKIKVLDLPENDQGYYNEENTNKYILLRFSNGHGCSLR